MDRIIKELKELFDQLHVHVRKYSCIIPCNLLSEEIECQINDFIDIDKEQFHNERKMIQVLWLYLYYKKRLCVGKMEEKARFYK